MADTTNLKTAHIVLDTPAALATVLGHKQSQAVVVETSKPAAAEALGITLHKFNKWASWEPQAHPVAGDHAGTVLWRSAVAQDHDDSFSWWYLTDEGIPVEVPWGEHAEDEDEGDDIGEYDTVMDAEHPEGSQVVFASRHVTLEDELADTVDRLELAVENGEDLDTVRSKATPQLAAHMMDLPELDDSEGAAEALGMDAEDFAAVAEHLDENETAPVAPLASDDAGLLPVISDEDWDHLTGKTPPTPNTDGVIVLDAKQTAELRRRQEAAAELTAMDNRSLAVKLMMGLNHWDRDAAEKAIGLGGVQAQMWTTAAQIAREHFDA